MSFICSGVKGFRKSVASENPEFLSLNEYLEIAKKQISYFGRVYELGFSKRLLNSEEAISFVAHANMIADWKYDPSKNMTRYSYRNNYAYYYIKYIHKNWKNNLEINESDLIGLNDGQLPSTNVMDLISPTIIDNPLINLIKKEEKEHINSIVKKNLGERDSKIFNMYIHEDSNLATIGRTFGLSRERVRQIVNKSTKIVKELL